MNKISPFSFLPKVLAIVAFIVLGIQTHTQAAGKPNSKFGGVQVGAITYSYRSMPDQSVYRPSSIILFNPDSAALS